MGLTLPYRNKTLAEVSLFVFLFCSKPTTPEPNPLDSLASPNAPTQEAARRTARHLAMLERLGDLAMEMAERVAVQAKQADQSPAEPAATQRDHVLTFSRISRCVRDTLALEARIAAGKLPATPREESENTPRVERENSSDPRRPLIKTFMSELIDTSPNPKSVKAGFRNQLENLITQGLADDPKQEQPAGAIVLEICQDLGLRCTPAQMPDELLVRPHRAISPAEKAAVANEVYRRIHGHDPP